MTAQASNTLSDLDEIGRKQNQTIFDVYNVYRLVLALILIISYYFLSLTSSLGSINPEFFIRIVFAYTAFNIAVFFRVFLPNNITLENSQYISVILIDIMFLVLISYTCGGVSSGMANLMIVPVASGTLIFRSRVSTFFAAVGSILVIYSEVYLNLVIDQGIDYFVQAGLLGFILFLVSGLLQYLGGKIRQNELLAREQAQNIKSLQDMNDQIIKRMQNGILVVNRNGNILTSNDAARRFLHTQETSDNINSLPATLAEQLQAWLQDNKFKAPHFRPENSSRELQASFTYLNPVAGKQPTILIFLEDYSLLTSRAQQLKLMSLGRLTASIAHEVRNPLGAISHASQLLNESDAVNTNDRRLIEIINTHSQRVNHIIESIMDLTRNKVEDMEHISLKPWLEQFTAKFYNSQQHPVTIEWSVDPENLEAQFNPGQLEQVLTNLFENGLRYSEKATGKATLSIECSIDPGDEHTVMHVMDDGTGIADEYVEQIFEPFFTTEQSGTGLGLFICREICDANYALLSYNRDFRGKSTFQIKFTEPDAR